MEHLLRASKALGEDTLPSSLSILPRAQPEEMGPLHLLMLTLTRQERPGS